MNILLADGYLLGETSDLIDTMVDISIPLKSNKYFSKQFYKSRLWIWIMPLDGYYSILCVKQIPEVVRESKYLFKALIINHHKQFLFKIVTTNNSIGAVMETFVDKMSMINVKNGLFAECLLNIESLHNIEQTFRK